MAPAKDVKMIRRITPRSTIETIFLRLSRISPIAGRANCPRIKGNRSVFIISIMAVNSEKLLLSVLVTIATIIGVRMRPISPDKVALKIAAGTFPRPIPVKATEDDTVEDKAPRKKKPRRKASGRMFLVVINKIAPINGKIINVVDWVRACSFHNFAPLNNLSRDNLAP